MRSMPAKSVFAGFRACSDYWRLTLRCLASASSARTTANQSLQLWSFQETSIDRDERQRMRWPDIWAVLLVSLPWLLLIGGGISMCVLYERGERIGPVGYTILAIMLVPQMVVILVLLWWRDSGFNCGRCGRPFSSRELPKIRQTGRCPGCGQTVPMEDLKDLE